MSSLDFHGISNAKSAISVSLHPTGFRAQFLQALGRLGRNPSRGLLINSCFAHCQSELAATWQFPGSPTMGNSVSTPSPLSGQESRTLVLQCLRLFQWAECQSFITFLRFLISKSGALQTIAEGVSSWFYDESSVKRIDGPYPRAASCHNNIYIPSESLEEVAL